MHVQIESSTISTRDRSVRLYLCAIYVVVCCTTAWDNVTQRDTKCVYLATWVTWMTDSFSSYLPCFKHCSSNCNFGLFLLMAV